VVAAQRLTGSDNRLGQQLIPCTKYHRLQQKDDAFIVRSTIAQMPVVPPSLKRKQASSTRRQNIHEDLASVTFLRLDRAQDHQNDEKISDTVASDKNKHSQTHQCTRIVV